MVFGVQACIFVMLYPYFQAVLGWSGLLSTAGLMPMALLMMVASGISPRLTERLGARATMLIGIALAGGGLTLLAVLVSVDGGYLSVLPGMITMGLGMGIAMTPSTEVITSSLPREQQGVASALNDVTREFGTALGVALLGALLTAGYRSAIEPALYGVPAATAAAAREGIANALHDAHATPALVNAAKQSFVEGWQTSMWAGVILMAALALFTALRGPKRPASDDL
ncbi:MFS transporter [Kribbella sp. NPDC005582]|uniref:MFS transporter n=1 Tax=Kribbella sp. NPDC005582 TaxID=3156893 RepID=UPI0033ACC934